MLEIAGISKRFGERLALDEASFVVRPGEVFGFVGANGAGKTTAMRIVLGVLRADAGTVRWQAIDAGMRRRIGYMPEERGLYPKMRVGEQLEYFAELHGLPRAEARGSMEAWTERLGIAQRRPTRCRSSRWATSSGCSCPPRWCTTRTSSSWTSPSRAWTRLRST